MAATIWNNFSGPTQRAWNEQAKRLNKLPVPGKFMNETNITVQQIMYGDTLSFFNFTHKQLKRGLDPDRSICNSSVYFGGPNNVIIRTAIYATRSFPTSIKLLVVDRLNSNEIIQRSPSCLYIHVVSASRLDKVFEMGDRSPMHAFNIKDDS